MQKQHSAYRTYKSYNNREIIENPTMINEIVSFAVPKVYYFSEG